MIVEIEQAK
jgi:hypothetical protein